jgi:hypothetical protein
MSNRLKWHKMTPFPTAYCLATQEELEAWCKKKKFSVPPQDATSLGGMISYGSALFVVVKPAQKHWDAVDTLIHESVHVFQRAMEYVGESESGIEAEAYNIASIATNLLKDYQEKYGDNR